MTSRKRVRTSRLLWVLALVAVGLSQQPVLLAQTPIFTSAAFYGGASDQGGTSIVRNGGGLVVYHAADIDYWIESNKR